MFDRGTELRVLMAAVAAGWGTLALASAQAQEKKDVAREPARRSGTIVGVISAKGKNVIEVKADGEEKARRYVPHWVGGAPSAGGGPDKKMLETIARLKVGSRIRLQWEFEERRLAFRQDRPLPGDLKASGLHEDDVILGVDGRK